MFVMLSYWNNVSLWYFYQNYNFKGTSWKAEFLAENGMKILLGMGIFWKTKMIEKWGFWGIVCHTMVNKVNFLVRFSVRLALIIFANLFYYSTYFYYCSWVPLYFLVLFMGFIVLFQLTFTFIYSTFSKKFSVSTK